MPTDYRALHSQYAQGMTQPGVVQQNSQPGFNFLQGWSASPHAGYLPPQQARQNPLQYGTPTAGGWQAGANGQPQGGANSWMLNGVDPRSFRSDGIRDNWANWVNGASTGANDPRAMIGDGISGNFRSWRDAYNPNMQQQVGKPSLMDQFNPGRNPNIPPGGI